ncbi:uncharacterized protein SPSK_04584 [Sporothrix schenckii 1099-18]|uniref:Uncharacterized protein n=1 Tax=Sporothrix schenckii 1099-18 TaxID=1397361 RepID=A0A0F2LZD4_SPOSC|nr:uncharacterized protein SPSK_04584 [Sporothrix schenckii 1099-18]KJR82827.1 hypothetical protein SPSK_04584 [Sporothrix schenckii 1099-18]
MFRWSSASSLSKRGKQKVWEPRVLSLQSAKNGESETECHRARDRERRNEMRKESNGASRADETERERKEATKAERLRGRRYRENWTVVGRGPLGMVSKGVASRLQQRSTSGESGGGKTRDESTRRDGARQARQGEKRKGVQARPEWSQESKGGVGEDDLERVRDRRREVIRPLRVETVCAVVWV